MLKYELQLCHIFVIINYTNKGGLMTSLIKNALNFNYYKRLNINQKINDKFADFRSVANIEFMDKKIVKNYLKLPKLDRV